MLDERAPGDHPMLRRDVVDRDRGDFRRLPEDACRQFAEPAGDAGGEFGAGRAADLDVEDGSQKESETACQPADDLPTIRKSQHADPQMDQRDQTKEKRPKREEGG